METSSRSEARRLVERISREHTLDGAIIGTRFESLLNNCLEILSSQLYANSTHFLLELIQNADDNTYDGVCPTLRFTYKPGSIRIDCNEVGFTAENVEAICAISQSTKSGKTGHGEYIGEKGIGFKSVFKVADVVWISSNDFTFKFDKSKSLGMVTPIWADFPGTTRPEYTSMYLQLSEDCDQEALVQELLTFDMNQLMFLRRIEEVSVQVFRHEQPAVEKTMRKTEAYQGEDRVVTLHDGSTNFSYLIRTHVKKDLPKERRRPNWPHTKVLVAFPTAEFPKQPQLKPENVYAFLPIRNYGLKFLLQGDFLLTANREDIESTLPWNCAIRDASVDAFLLSISHFNKGQMKYVWPYYLPSASTSACSFLEPAVTSILTNLRESHVLESCAGTMSKPSSLRYVPLDRFADGHGIPFTLGPHTEASYLSLKYPAWALGAISSIGVSEISPREFLEHLDFAMGQDPTAFRSRSAEWHSQLAETLIKLATEPELMSIIQRLYLIPLHDGNWTCGREGAIFFSRNETSLDLPSGIEVLILDSKAESDPIRRTLFASLGVKDWETSEICRLVLKVHGSAEFDPKTLTGDQLISHAKFLYQASWRPPKTADLWFATVQDERSLGRKLYIPGYIEKNSTAARIFAHLQKQFPVIHGDYLDAFPSDPDWPTWLVDNVGLSMVPRLVTPPLDPEPQPTKALEDSMMDEEVDQTSARSQQYLEQQQQQGHRPDLSQQLMGMPEAQSRPQQPSLPQEMRLLSRQDKAKVVELAHKIMANASEEQKAATRMQLNRGLTSAQLAEFHAEGKDPLIWFYQNHAFSVLKANVARTQKLPLVYQQINNEARTVNSVESSPKPTASAPIFDLSEEFIFLFNECDTSDVLQLLKDNWQHYSRWIEGCHMKWQSADFRQSSIQLSHRLGACLVQSAKGILPLQETVLPRLEPELDEGRLIPAVKIKEPMHPDWALLSHFGVLIKTDIHYFLRCLIAISEQPVPDVNIVAYIYEQIQNRYRGNEELIGAAFQAKKIVLSHSETGKPTRVADWMSMRECVSRSIAIEDQYQSCSYLFRCLASPTRDPIASVIATATLITSSSSLEDIARFFCDVSAALKNINAAQVAQVLRPLQNRPIFPVLDSSPKRGFDRLLSIQNTSWFIADRPAIKESFHGKLPLLALPTEDLSASEDLFRVLNLDWRMLSKIASSQTHPKGRVTTHWNYTNSLRRKSPFIKALIPHWHHDRATIARQMDEVRVSVATKISQSFALDLNGTRIHGHSVDGQVSMSRKNNSLHLFMTSKCAKAKCPPYGLVSLIADTCGIKDPDHYSLLCTALSNSSLQDIFSTFTQRGLHVKGLVLDKSESRIRVQSGDMIRIPLPSSTSLRRLGRSFRGVPDVTRFGVRHGETDGHANGRDRRLPIVNLARSGGSVCEDTLPGRFVPESHRIAGWDHVQHLGEHMFSKLLLAYLGQAYDPERDWTSDLRSRSGYTCFHGSWARSAAFTMADPEASAQLTSFFLKYGHSQTPNWKEKLRVTPSVYHLDLAVSARGKSSPFVVSSSQVERMRRFRMRDYSSESKIDIAVLVRVSDVYSDDELSFDLHIDPWRLFDESTLVLEGDWIFQASMHDNHPKPDEKRRRVERPSIPWAMPIDSRPHPNSRMTLPSHRNGRSYTYSSLSEGHIRLLYLLPGESDDQLHGVIVQVPYLSSGTYRAVSYVWGTGRRTQKLTTPDGALPISASLARCLRRLRHKNNPTMLWVDAISINQNDNKEKARQIRLLAKIFQRAASVYGFVEPSKGCDTAIEMLMQVQAKAICEESSESSTASASDTESEISDTGSKSNQSMDTDHGPGLQEPSYSEGWPEDLPEVPASWVNRPIPHLDDPIWAAVESFFAASWFRRAWIIQESVAASNIRLVCGKWIIHWDDLYHAMEIVDREVQESDHDFSHFRSNWKPFMSLTALREWEAMKSRWPLMTLLENFRHAESTLSRDRLFALLGLASDGNEQAFEPDYESRLEDIVLRFARVFVGQGRGMLLLYRASLTSQSHRFPSWIPDWTVKRPSSLSDSTDGGLPFLASGPQQSKIECIPDTDELRVAGYEVDVIDRISQFSNLEHEWPGYFREVDEMVDSLALIPVSCSSQDLKWKVPIAGVEYDSDMEESYKALRMYLNEKEAGNGVKERRHSSNHKACSSATAVLAQQISRYINALQDRVKGWRFVVTKRGYTGVVPHRAQNGDIVAILKGGRVPFILQKSSERHEGFRLVGEGYIHGIMNGEALSLHGVLEREFRIF